MIKKILRDIGIPQNILGHGYIVQAVQLVKDNPSMIHHVTKELYPGVAKACGTTASKVERAIRHAIEKAFNNPGSLDTVERIFGNTISADTGRPTNAHFIAAVIEDLNATRVCS